MSIAEKLSTVVENIPKVYDAGYVKGQESMVDESKIIEKTVSGIGFVNIDDVSEIPHNVSIKLSSDTITDFSNMQLTVIGNNLFDIEDYEQFRDSNGAPYIDISKFKIDTVLTISTKDETVFKINKTAGAGATANGGVQSEKVTSWNFRVTETYRDLGHLYLVSPTTWKVLSKSEIETKNVQLEIGSVVRGYEPFKSTTYTPNANGEVNVKSISPVMNMCVDETNINISANYHKSYGMQTEYDRFWDAFQENGNRKVYHHAFCFSGWNDETFKPKYNITPTNGSDYMFEYCKITNFAEALKQSGITLDFSVTSMYNTFYYAQKLTHLPPIIPKSGTKFSSTWYGCSELVSIEKLVVDSKHTFSSVFNYCSNLVNLIIEGTIGNNGLNLQWSTKLSKESITSVINALSTTTTGLTVTLSKTAVNNAFNIDVDDTTTYPEGSEYYTLRHSKDNWTISYV